MNKKLYKLMLAMVLLVLLVSACVASSHDDA